MDGVQGGARLQTLPKGEGFIDLCCKTFIQLMLMKSIYIYSHIEMVELGYAIYPGKLFAAFISFIISLRDLVTV